MGLGLGSETSNRVWARCFLTEFGVKVSFFARGLGLDWAGRAGLSYWGALGWINIV